jgi:peptide/nickel transport system ATP-binding protein
LLNQIPGTTPSLLALPPGCSFAPRCGRASDVCRSDPPYHEDGLRAWRCHHPLERSA